MKKDKIEDFGWGWAFYKGAEIDLSTITDLKGFVGGFAAAMADYNVCGEYDSLESALNDYELDKTFIIDCLAAADEILSDVEGGWIRWPAQPVRAKTMD